MTPIETTMLLEFGKKLDGVADTVSRVDQWAESIDARLRTLNGTVARHEQRLVELESAAVARRAAREAADKVSAKYQRWLNPIARYCLFGLFVLILDHGPEVIAQVGKFFRP